MAIDRAVPADLQVIFDLIVELAAYERLSDEVTATPDDIRRSLFADPPAAEALIARLGGTPVGFALFFHTFSTFLGRRGLYLEDLYVRPEARGRGCGRRLLVELARIAVERGCGRMEWAVLDWNELAIRSYRRAGAQPMDAWTTWRITGPALEKLAEGS